MLLRQALDSHLKYDTRLWAIMCRLVCWAFRGLSFLALALPPMARIPVPAISAACKGTEILLMLSLPHQDLRTQDTMLLQQTRPVLSLYSCMHHEYCILSWFCGSTFSVVPRPIPISVSPPSVPAPALASMPCPLSVFISVPIPVPVPISVPTSVSVSLPLSVLVPVTSVVSVPVFIPVPLSVTSIFALVLLCAKGRTSFSSHAVPTIK